MATTQSPVTALVKALATHSQTARKTKKDLAFERAQVNAAYNALEADRLLLLTGGPGVATESTRQRSGLSIERHFERVKVAENALKQVEHEYKDNLRNLWTATVRLRDVMEAETGPELVVEVEQAPSEASTESEL